MLTAHKIRTFDLSAAATPAQHAHLSAASGLVCVGDFHYVVADDELHLGVFDAAGGRPGHLIRLFPGELPANHAPRKALKPDLETLMRLPPFAGHAHGALLALGSASTHARRRGALLALNAQGAIEGATRLLDLTALCDTLSDTFPALNIEGGFVNGGEFCLLQRGNKILGVNALIRWHLAPLLDALTRNSRGPFPPPFAIHPADLGGIDGTPLCFTDGAALPGGDIVFSAAAENTRDHYNDGPCLGAALGIMDKSATVRCLHRLDQPHKVEGVDARVQGDLIHLLLVTDADDAAIAASLLSATIALP